MRPIKGIWCTETDLYICGTKVELTVGQHYIFRHLASNPDRVFTRNELNANREYRAYFKGTNYFRGVDCVIKHIRRRIKLATGYTQIITTHYKLGYQLNRRWHVAEWKKREADR